MPSKGHVSRASAQPCGSARAAALLVGLVFALVSCGKAPLEGSPRRPLLEGLRPLTDASKRAPAWYHPAAPKLATRVIATGDESLWLASGERWLTARPADFGRKGAGAKTAPPRVAQTLAPEPLVSAVEMPSSRWLFVGNSGTVYLARSPLGRFEAARAPPRRLRRPTASATAVMGIDATGQLWRSADEGLSWKRVPVTKDVDERPARVVDVGLLPSGQGLSLTLPEAVYLTRDHGLSWRRAALPAGGALRLMPRFLRDQKGIAQPALALGALSETRAFITDPTSPSGGRFLGAGSVFALPAFPQGIPKAANALAVRSSRAVLAAERYYELEVSTATQSLWRGDIWSPLSKAAGKLPGDCSSVALAANGDFVYVICEGEKRRISEARVYRSVDAGESFEREPYSLVVDFKQLKAVVSSSGQLVLSGACPARVAREGCQPRGIQVRTQSLSAGSGKKTVALTEAAVPFIQGNALALAAAGLGDRVYAAGMRPKSEVLVVFVSEDGGRTFQPKPQAQAVVTASDFNARRKLLDLQEMRVAADGHVSLVMVQRSSRSQQLLVLNERGDQVSLALAPSKDHKLSANGLRALAIGQSSRELWVTSDGGFSWQPLGELPEEVCKSNRDGGCKVEFSCADEGCLVGASMTRSWGQPELELPLPTPLDDAAPLVANDLKSPISCEIDPERAWQSVANNDPPDVWQTGFPSGPDWFLATANRTTGEAQLSEGLGDSAELRQRSLFGAGVNASPGTLGLRLQVEGIAAVRQKKNGPIELAWTNYFESRAISRGTLPQGRLPASSSGAAVKRAEPALLSVARGGIYLKPETKLYFVRTGGGVHSLASPPWSTQERQHRFEMLRVGDQHLHLRFAAGAVGFIRALQREGRWKKDAAATGLLEPGTFGLRQGATLSYFRGRPHLHTSYSHRSGSEAWLFPFSVGEAPLEAPLRVPTQEDLPEQPKVCSSELRVSTPRVVAVAQAADQHAVAVLSDTEVFAPLTTDAAVLYGKQQAPCVQFFATRPARSGKGEQAYVLVHPDPTRYSWVFRKKGKTEPLEVRPAHCSYDAKQAISVPTVEPLSAR